MERALMRSTLCTFEGFMQLDSEVNRTNYIVNSLVKGWLKPSFSGNNCLNTDIHSITLIVDCTDEHNKNTYVDQFLFNGLI